MLHRAINWIRGIFKHNPIGWKIDGYDRACIRVAEIYDRQAQYIRRLERQS